jgi:hypothetical protein
MADDAGEISVQITAQIDGLMSGLNEATNGVKTATAEMADSFSGVKGESTQAFEQMAGDSKDAAESMEGDFSRTEARHAAHMLGMNRAVGGFVSTLPGVGQALSMAFAPLAIMEMIEWIAKGVEKLVSLHEAAAESAHKMGIALADAANTGVIKMSELDDKLVEAQDKADDLAGNHIGALRGQLELLDHASLRDLIKSLEEVTAEADKTFEVLFTNAKAWYDIFGQNTALIAGAKSAWDGYAEAQKQSYADQLAAEAKVKAASNPAEKLAAEKELESVRANAAKNTADTIDAANKNLAAQQFLLQHANDTYLQRQDIAKQLGAAEATIGNSKAIIDNNSIRAQQLLIAQLNQRKNVVQAIANIEAQEASNAKTEAPNKDNKSREGVGEAKVKGIEQANAAALTAADKGADEALKLQEATIKQEVALAIEGGQLKAAAELAALPKYIAAQQSFTQAKLTALDKDHAAQLKANADEQTILEAGNSGGQNNAKLVENANQRAAIESKYQTERASIVAAGKDAVLALDTQESNQRTELAKKGCEARIAASEKEVKADGEALKDASKAAEEAYKAAVARNENLGKSGKLTATEVAQAKITALATERASEDKAYQAELDALEKIKVATLQAMAGVPQGSDQWKALEKELEGVAEKIHAADGAMRAFDNTNSISTKNLQTDVTKMQNTWTSYFQKMNSESKNMTATFNAGMQKCIDQMNTGFANAMSKSIVEGKNFGQAMRQMASQVLEQFLSMCIGMALKWAETQLMNAILAKTTQTASSVGTVASEAAVGAAAAMASTAAIPIVGPALAPAAGAAMYTSILGTYGPLSSAAGGWDRVPSDTLAQLHKNEMVLPASLASSVRNMATGGSGGSGDTHLHIHGGVDSKAFFQQNQGNIMATIREAMKNRRG